MVDASLVRPHIGMEITPSIRLTRPLGVGGMGSVWVGHHVGLETDVAVKFLSADLSTSEGALQRFHDEASVAAQIKSPHVVQVYDHGVVGELPFIVMELLDGEDLAVHVHRRGLLDLAKVALLVQQLGHVLGKAHAVGIVHRDVKPENVVLVEGYGDLFLKLIDFGIAKQVGRSRSLTAAGMMVGTPDFMCPEQLLNARDVGPSADLWSLACVAYYALLGTRPFERETLPATLLAIEKGDIALPFERYGMGSTALDAFFSRALFRDQAGRFASLNELVVTFCEAAEVPVTRSLRLVADDGAVSSGHAGRSGSTRSASVSTRPDLPASSRGPQVTRVGPPALLSALPMSGAATAHEPVRSQTLESGTVVQQPAQAGSASPAALENQRRARARRWILAAVWSVALIGGAAALAFARTSRLGELAIGFLPSLPSSLSLAPVVEQEPAQRAVLRQFDHSLPEDGGLSQAAPQPAPLPAPQESPWSDDASPEPEPAAPEVVEPPALAKRNSMEPRTKSMKSVKRTSAAESPKPTHREPSTSKDRGF